MLYLLPNLLSPEADPRLWFPAALWKIVPTLDGLFCESEKEGRRYLKLFDFPEGKSFRDVPLRLVNEHTQEAEIESDQTWGLISDCGLPLLADPGARLVPKASKVIALSGPSSIILALMLSGMSGQNFAFHGYLPREEEKRKQKIALLEKRAREEGSVHIFIETPYRNKALFDALLHTLSPHTLLCVATDLTGPAEHVETRPIKEWKRRSPPSIHKLPSIFLLTAP